MKLTRSRALTAILAAPLSMAVLPADVALSQVVIERIGPDGYVRRYMAPPPMVDPSRQVPPRYAPPPQYRQGYYGPPVRYAPGPYQGYPTYRRAPEWRGGAGGYGEPAPAPKIQKISSPTFLDYKPDPVSRVAIADLLPGGAPVDAAPTPVGALRLDRNTVPQAVTIGVEKDIAGALTAHYAAEPFALWVRDGQPTEAARKVLALMREAGAHGLEPGHYAVSPPAPGGEDTAGRAELAAFEVSMSARVLRYAMDMKDGAIRPNRLSGYHDLPPRSLTAEDAIRQIAAAADPLAWLEGLEPQQAAYRALQKELAALREVREAPIVIAEGTLVRPGDMHPELPQIVRALEARVAGATLERHRAAIEAYGGGPDYGPGLVALVRDFQQESGLKADGIIGRNTIARLTGGSAASKAERVAMAMERLRWLSERFGERHVIINQPAYTASYREGERTVLATRAIVGSKANQTYFFQDEIETVVYNPYWGVPQSIIVNEMLPKLHRDPSYLDRNGYEVTDVSGRRIASAGIDWWQYTGKVPFDIRQKPGPNNALGGLKILFPNAHAIYMHDTPERHLFDRDERALSHGCVRLQEPHRMAALLLGKSVEHVRANIGGQEHQESLPRKVPIYVAYFTAWPDDSGNVAYFADMYGRDAHLAGALARTSDVRLSGEPLPAIADGR